MDIISNTQAFQALITESLYSLIILGSAVSSATWLYLTPGGHRRKNRRTFAWLITQNDPSVYLSEVSFLFGSLLLEWGAKSVAPQSSESINHTLHAPSFFCSLAWQQHGWEWLILNAAFTSKIYAICYWMTRSRSPPLHSWKDSLSDQIKRVIHNFCKRRSPLDKGWLWPACQNRKGAWQW